MQGTTLTVTVTVLLWLLCAVIGAAIGNTKGRDAEGFGLGFVLGVIGVVIAALMRPARRAEIDEPVARASALGSLAVALGLFCLIAIATLSVLTWREVEYASRPTLYQLQVVDFDDAQIATQLSMLGGMGWHATNCRRAVVGDGGAYECIMERAYKAGE